MATRARWPQDEQIDRKLGPYVPGSAVDRKIGVSIPGGFTDLEAGLGDLISPLDGSAYVPQKPIQAAAPAEDEPDWIRQRAARSGVDLTGQGDAGGTSPDIYEMVKQRILEERGGAQQGNPEADAERQLSDAEREARIARRRAGFGLSISEAADLITGSTAGKESYKAKARSADEYAAAARGKFDIVKNRILEERQAKERGAKLATDAEQDRRDFAAEQGRFEIGRQDAAAARAAAVGESQKDRDFRAEQAKIERDERARQAALDRAAAKAAAAQKSSIIDPKIPNDLRKEFNGLPEVKAFKEVEISHEKMRKVAANPSPAGDIAMVFSFMKMMDPGSTVREGEFATAQNAAGVPTQIVNAYNKALEGTRLSPEQRNDFLKQAGSFRQAHEEPYRRAVEQYRGLAGRFGASPDDVASAPRAAQPQPMTGNVSLEQPPQQQAKTPVRVVPSKDRQWVKVIYADGTEEVKRAGTN